MAGIGMHQTWNFRDTPRIITVEGIKTIIMDNR